MKWWWSCFLVIWTLFHDAVASPGYDDYGGGGHFGDPNVIHKVVDYYAKPKYAFGYEVDGLDDYFRELSHGRWEIRDGDVTQGQYRVLLPDGRIQIVSYIADKFGYRPTIQYINKGAHPPPPPVYAKVKIPKIIHPVIAPVPVIEDHGHGYGYGGQYGHQYGPSYGYGGHALGGGGYGGHAIGGGGYGGGFGGHHGGHGGGYIDPIFALGSVNPPPRKVARKRALLFDRNRTLFRKDVERKRRSDKAQGQVNTNTNLKPAKIVPVPVPQETKP